MGFQMYIGASSAILDTCECYDLTEANNPRRCTDWILLPYYTSTSVDCTVDAIEAIQ